MRKIGLFALLLAAGIARAAIEVAPGEGWGYADVVGLIEARRAAKKPFQTIDELIKEFPPGLKKYFTFVYATRNRLQDASRLHPRAVVYAEKLLYTFNGHKDQRGYDELELIEFDRDARRFHLREITTGPAGLEYATANPPKCLECHGADPRPVWDNYDKWPGVYGSNDDYLRDNNEEKDYKTFLDSLKANPESRYNLLTFPAGTPIPPYGRGGPGDKYRVNLLLTQMLTRMNALRVARLFEEAPYYSELKWTIPDAVYTQTVQGGRPYAFACPLADHPEQPFLPLLRRLARLHAPHREPTGQMPHLLFEAFGLPPDRVSMARGTTEYQYFDGTEHFLQVLRTATLKPLVAADAELRSRVRFDYGDSANIYKDFALYRHIDSLVGKLWDVDVQRDPCSYIGEKGEEQLGLIAKNGLPPFPPRPQALDFAGQIAEAETRRASTEVPLSCVVCHTVRAAPPHLSFDNETALARELKADGGRRLAASINRTHPDVVPADRMPPVSQSDFAPLTPDEARKLEVYLRRIAR